jgi:putative nucleotidyltransferase with HDIG domain
VGNDFLAERDTLYELHYQEGPAGTYRGSVISTRVLRQKALSVELKKIAADRPIRSIKTQDGTSVGCTISISLARQRMRLATRTFWWSFVPVALLLITGFWATRVTVGNAIREALRSAAHKEQLAVTQERAKMETRMARILRGVGVTPILEASVERLLAERHDPLGARHVVEEQLTDTSTNLGFDALTVFDADGLPRAGVMRLDARVMPLEPSTLNVTRAGLFTSGGQVYEVSSVSISRGSQVLGSLAVGDRFDLSGFAMPLILTWNGGVVQSYAKGIDPKEIETAFAVCAPEKECEVKLRGESYLSVPLLSGPLEEAVTQGYSLRTLQSVDVAGAPVQAALRNLFIAAGAAVLLAALVLSALSSRSIVRPISKLVEHLRTTDKTGVLPEFRSGVGRIQEIRELAAGFNQAAASIKNGRDNLVRAYVEFTGSLASALDARDPYTAGHSRRVSEYACAIARAMNLLPPELEIIRVGALLHDLGKIGISDSLLLKPGSLTPEEFTVLKEHPVIGRRILEGVQGFQSYLDIVELHHENWDGSGYPRGLMGDETPLSARIVKVADAYDAMTSDRPYRPGMSHDEALQKLRAMTGSQVDPAVMAAVEKIQLDTIVGGQEQMPGASMDELLHNLNRAVQHSSPPSRIAQEE